MRESDQHNDDFLKDRNPVEDLLIRLEPTPSGVDRAGILKHAAHVSTRDSRPMTGWRRWFWPVSTALSLTAAITLGCLYAIAANKPEPNPRIVYIKQPVQQPRPGKSETRRPNVPRTVGNLRLTERLTIPEDRSTVVSLVARSRFPALATNADNLPETRPRSGSSGERPPTLGKPKRLLEGVGGFNRSAKAQPGFSLFPWNL